MVPMAVISIMPGYTPPETGVLQDIRLQPLCQSDTDDMTYREGDWE